MGNTREYCRRQRTGEGHKVLKIDVERLWHKLAMVVPVVIGILGLTLKSIISVKRSEGVHKLKCCILLVPEFLLMIFYS